MLRPIPRDDLKSVLVRVASGLNVTKLLEALNMTTEFEHDMERKLGMKVNARLRRLRAFQIVNA